MVVGVLALQGAFQKHIEALKELNCDSLPVNDLKTLARCDGIILPGGESTAMLKLLNYDLNFYSALREFVTVKPVYGTCAGAILLAKTVLDPPQESFGAIDIVIRRNAFGRQLQSFVTDLLHNGEPNIGIVNSCSQKKGYFIRAPRIEKLSHDTKPVLYLNEEVVAATQGLCLVSTFHPELTDDRGIYCYFLENYF